MPVSAEVPWIFDNNTRYMVMGDSLGAGYGAIPQTEGYAYLLYKQGTFDKMNDTLLTNASVIGVTSVVGDVDQAMQLMDDPCRIHMADIHSAFDGQTGLLLIERNNAEPFQIHPTNAGHRAIADAFEAVIQ